LITTLVAKIPNESELEFRATRVQWEIENELMELESAGRRYIERVPTGRKFLTVRAEYDPLDDKEADE